MSLSTNDWNQEAGICLTGSDGVLQKGAGRYDGSACRKQSLRMNRGGSGFTLVELLVVILIIGILAGLLIPAVGSAIRRSREFTIQTDLNQIGASFEKFKRKFGVYPIDMKNPNVVVEFVDRLSDRHVYNKLQQTYGVYILASGQQLENPYAATSGGAFRDPATMDAAECYVFFLGELTNNPEYPLGYVYDSGSGNWLLDPNAQNAGQHDFQTERLTDLDNDGWLEYVPASGRKIPYVHFDSRTYSSTDQAIVDTAFYTQGSETGVCVPYSDPSASFTGAASPVVLGGFNEPEGYQLHSAGLDGVYGEDWANGETVSTIRRCNDFIQVEWNGSAWELDSDAPALHRAPGLGLPHNDNFIQYFEGRLDRNKS